MSGTRYLGSHGLLQHESQVGKVELALPSQCGTQVILGQTTKPRLPALRFTVAKEQTNLVVGQLAKH